MKIKIIKGTIIGFIIIFLSFTVIELSRSHFDLVSEYNNIIIDYNKLKLNSNNEIVDTLISIYKLNKEKANLIGSSVYYFSKKLDIPWQIIIAKIKVESNFNYLAKSNKKTKSNGDKKAEYARGLMQLKPSTAREICHEFGMEWLGTNMLYSPFYNIKFGTYYLYKMRGIFGNKIMDMVISYNIGCYRYYNILNKKEKMPENYQHWNKVKKEIDKLRS